MREPHSSEYHPRGEWLCGAVSSVKHLSPPQRRRRSREPHVRPYQIEPAHRSKLRWWNGWWRVRGPIRLATIPEFGVIRRSSEEEAVVGLVWWERSIVSVCSPPFSRL